MRERRWGRFVHVGSTAAKEAVHDIPHVVMNTMAPSIMGLLKSLSDEFSAEGITFNSVGPGWCNTKAMEQLMRSEEHTSELQSLMRISYAVFCLKKKINTTSIRTTLPAYSSQLVNANNKLYYAI